MILGFYLADIHNEIYLGSHTPVLDTEEVIRWGDHLRSTLTSTAVAGFAISQKDTVDATIITAFKSGSGDKASTPIPYLGRANKILDIDERMSVTLLVSTPSAEDKQINKATILNVGLSIAYIEIPERLQNLLIPSEI